MTFNIRNGSSQMKNTLVLPEWKCVILCARFEIILANDHIYGRQAFQSGYNFHFWANYLEFGEWKISFCINARFWLLYRVNNNLTGLGHCVCERCAHIMFRNAIWFYSKIWWQSIHKFLVGLRGKHLPSVCIEWALIFNETSITSRPNIYDFVFALYVFFWLCGQCVNHIMW